MSNDWSPYQPGGFQPSANPAPSASPAPTDPYGAADPYASAALGYADPYAQASAAQLDGAGSGWDARAQSSSAPAPYAPPSQPYAAAPGPHGVTSQPYGFGVKPEHPQGGTVLTLGILSFFLPILAIPGLVIGASARRQVREGLYRPSGSLTAGWILSWVFLAFTVISLLVFLIMFLILMTTTY